MGCGSGTAAIGIRASVLLVLNAFPGDFFGTKCFYSFLNDFRIAVTFWAFGNHYKVEKKRVVWYAKKKVLHFPISNVIVVNFMVLTGSIWPNRSTNLAPRCCSDVLN